MNELDHAKAELINARNQISKLQFELEKMTEWKDSAYSTIQEIADALYGKEWSGGKFQVEIIGHAEHMRTQLESWQSMERVREMAEWSKDTARIDHAELHKYCVYCMAKVGEDGRWNGCYWTPDIGAEEPHEFQTLREAIDWAMANPEEIK